MSVNVNLIISEQVQASEEIYVSHVPAQGSEVIVRLFCGEAAFNETCNVRLVWDYGGASEQIIWTIKGASRMLFVHKIEAADVDGVKELAVVLENASTVNVFMSGYAEITEG